MDQRIEALIADMTLEEKVSLAAGSGPWHTVAIERLGIPRLKVTDGPNGARGDGASGATAVCFPVGSALAASWDVDLMAQVGAVLGDEAASKGAQLLLGPTINIHRSPLAGRNFECYSEDPELTAQLAVAFIEGVQSTGVGACAKHFVCNDSEWHRTSASSEVDERTLREVYLRPFEAATKTAGVWSVMAAYNRINGPYACAHEWLLTSLLKEEWDWDGFVVSDWGAVMDTAPSANAGTDLEMPGPARRFGPKLVDAVKNGEVDETIVDDKVRRLLRWAVRSGRLDAPIADDEPERSVDTPERRALARKAAADGMVLLKNEAVLPLHAATIKRLAVIGPNADPGQIQGGGSSGVNTHYAVSPVQALRDRLPDVEVLYAPGPAINKYATPLDPKQFVPLEGEAERGMEVVYFDSTDLSGEGVHRRNVRHASVNFWGQVPGVSDSLNFSARWTGTFVPAVSGIHTFGAVAVGRCRVLVDGDVVVDNWTEPEPGDAFFGGATAERRGDVELTAGVGVKLEVEYARSGEGTMGGIRVGMEPPVEADPVAEAVEAARHADAAIVVVGLTADWETEGNDRADWFLPGRQVELIRAVADVNPRTIVVVNAGSPIDMSWIDGPDAVLWAWYPGMEMGNALADVIFGDVCPSGRLATTFPKRLEDTSSFLDYPGQRETVQYSEGVFVGYRWFDRRKIAPRFPFGHGLSYTRFVWSDPRVSGSSTELVVEVDVTNTGDRRGADVVQLYVRDVQATVIRPDKELKAFAKVALDPGETRTARLALDARSFAFWDPDVKDWVVEPGAFELLVAANATDVRSVVPVTV